MLQFTPTSRGWSSSWSLILVTLFFFFTLNIASGYPGPTTNDTSKASTNRGKTLNPGDRLHKISLSADFGHHAKRSKQNSIHLVVPTFIYHASQSPTNSNLNLSAYETRGPALAGRGLGQFVMKAVTTVLGGNWAGRILTTAGLTCSITTWITEHAPKWLKHACNATAILGVVSNVYGGWGTLRQAWQNRNIRQHQAPTEVELWMLRDHLPGPDSSPVKRADIDELNQLAYEKVLGRIQDDRLLGFHFHDLRDNMAILPIQSFVTANESTAKIHALSIDGTVHHAPTKMWTEGNGTHAWFVSTYVPHFPLSPHEQRDSASPHRDDQFCIGQQCFKEDGNPAGTGNDEQVYYGDNWHGGEKQFEDLETQACCRDLDHSVYWASMVSNTLDDHQTKRLCVCTQDEGQSITTGAVEFVARGEPYTPAYHGFQDCFQDDCGGSSGSPPGTIR